MRFKFAIIDAPNDTQVLGVPLYNSEGARVGQIIAEYAPLRSWTACETSEEYRAEDRRQK